MSLEMAVLLIKDRRNTSVAEYNTDENDSKKGAVAGLKVSRLNTSDLPFRDLGSFSKSIKKALNVGFEDNSMHSSDIQASQKMFKVQFNPEQLTFSANSSYAMRERRTNLAVESKEQKQQGEKPESTSELNAKKLNGQEKVADKKVKPPKVYMSFTIILDAVYQNDAFMHTSGIGENVMGVVNMLRGKTYSVQPYVEALIAAIRNSRTREVVFSWGDMCYEGTLTTVSSKYTMFNTAGSPVRANIDITLILDNYIEGGTNTNFKDAYDLLVNQA